MLGEGSYGTVVKAKCLASKKSVAVKMIKVESQYQYTLVKVLRELQIMEYLSKSK